MTLEQLRLRAGLTQDQLAEKVGVNRVTISNWENGQGPRVSLMKPLADALGVTIAEVYDAIQKTAENAKK